MIATGASGFGIMAIIVATERGFITRDQAVERLTRITSFLSQADKFHGAVSHFIDGSTGKTIPYFGTKDNGGDLVETSFLAQGLLAARQYFTRNTDNEKLIREELILFGGTSNGTGTSDIATALFCIGTGRPTRRG